ncbi:MAG: hypothetical protein K0S09_2881 [Sphingobacteriaceae bacterium]|jgi:hypothetical protein|nr:hypothetical protein [Sphingobacteriaceae bacterium]
MQEKHLFEYAVVRFVPRVEREEFVNVGVVFYCAKLKFLKALFLLDESKIDALCKDIDCDGLRQNLEAFERICVGGKGAGPIGQLDVASRFRWLTAARSTVLQTSKVHPGFCEDPDATLRKLYEDLVL